MTLVCSNCGSRYREKATYDLCVDVVREYTDGRYRTSPPTSTHLLFYCPTCQTTSSIEKARETGRRTKTPLLARMFTRGEYAPPPIAYIEFIHAMVVDSPDREVCFRLEAWRASNDPFRDLPDRLKPFPEDRPAWWRDNIKTLQALITPIPGAAGVLLAELSREAGDFTGCLRQIATHTTDAMHDGVVAAPGIIKNKEGTFVDLGLLDVIHKLAVDMNPFVQAVTPGKIPCHG